MDLEGNELEEKTREENVEVDEYGHNEEENPMCGMEDPEEHIDDPDSQEGEEETAAREDHNLKREESLDDKASFQQSNEQNQITLPTYKKTQTQLEEDNLFPFKVDVDRGELISGNDHSTLRTHGASNMTSNVYSGHSIPEFPKPNIIPELPMRSYEVYSQYKNRKQVYENVMKDLKDPEKALSYSNIWYNMYYLKNRYPKNVEDAVSKYTPV